MSKLDDTQIQYVRNKFYSAKHNEGELSFFSNEKIKEVLKFQKTHPNYTNTPLISLENLSEYLNVSNVLVKDEAQRFQLNAFKVMGGIYAIGKYIANQLKRDMSSLSFEELQSPEVKKQLGEITFISATDGNHGRGVAWAARELGQKSIIYMPKGSSKSRLQAIRNEGAKADITAFNYDETVRMCAKLADENGWVMVQDTAWEGYDEIPLWIMQGYASIAKEIIDEIEDKHAAPPTHIFLQAGVGSFAAGIAAYFSQYYRNNPPKIIVVEPDLADCYYRSFANNEGNIQAVTGEMDSIMAGLCCGEPNTRAFRILKQYAYAFYACADPVAALGMRVLGNPLGKDQRIISGESGAVTTGLLFYLTQPSMQKIAADIMLDKDSNILVINTEGDTDFQHYLDVVWKGHYQY